MEILNTYNHLKKLHEENEKDNLVIFVGAGISENYANIKDDKNFPSWNDLITNIKLDSNETTKDYLQIAQIYQDNYSKDNLLEKVKSLFPKNYKHGKIHELIFELNPVHILTTNYDDLLEKAMEKKHLDLKYHVVSKDNSIASSNSKQNLLLKAHGDFCSGNIVLSESDYNNYEKDYPLILSFIKYVFSKYKVLFLGFSLTDPNFIKILSSIKDILQDDSIEHSVIFHENISDSEKKYFFKKSINVITRSEVKKQICDETATDETYLLEVLKFIKHGFPVKNYPIEKRLDRLIENIEIIKSLKYLLPEVIRPLLKNTFLTINFDSIVKKKDNYYSWISNLYQEDTPLDGKDRFNLLQLLRGNSDVILKDDFTKKYFDKVSKLLLYLNINTIGYKNSLNNFFIIENELKNIDIKNNELSFLSTYVFDGKSFLEDDKSFEEDSPFYKSLIFSENDFFSNYINGNINKAYLQCKNLQTNLYEEKYITYFNIKHLWNQRNLMDKDVELDVHIIDIYKKIYKGMDKLVKNIYQPIHELSFVQNYIDYLYKIEKKYKENKTKKSEDLLEALQNEFYLHYSRYLKFIILNKLTIFNDIKVQQSIEISNKLYFKYLKKIKDNKLYLSNWMILSIALDKEEKQIRDLAIELDNELFEKNMIIYFDNSYVEDLFLKNKESTESYLKLKNLFYILALSSKDEQIFLWILNVYKQLIESDFNNLDVYSESIYMAYINYDKYNRISNDVKEILALIIDKFVFIKLTEKIKRNDSFIKFIFMIDEVNEYKNERITSLIESGDLRIYTSNLSIFFRGLKLLGYKINEIRPIIKQISNEFQLENFYVLKPNYNNSEQEIELGIIEIFKSYNEDIGLDKLLTHHLEEFESSLTENGYSSQISFSCKMLNYLIDINNKYIKKIVQKLSSDNFHMFICQLTYLSNNKHSIEFENNIIKEMSILFIKLNKFDFLNDDLRNIIVEPRFLKLIISNYSLLDRYRDNLFELIQKCKNDNIDCSIYIIESILDSAIKNDLDTNKIIEYLGRIIKLKKIYKF